MNNKKKLGKLTEKQNHFIRLFINDFDIVEIIDDLEITENTVTNWMTTNPVFLSSLNSAIFLRELSLYVRQVNLRIAALKQLEVYVNGGDIDAIHTALSNIEKFPEFNASSFSSLKIKKAHMNDFLKSIETDLNIPWRYRKDFFDDDDSSPPF